MIHILEKGEKADPLWGCGEEIITDDMIEALQQGKRLYITVNDEYAVVIKKDGKRKTDNPEATDTDTISRQAAIDFIDAGHLCNPNEPRWSDNEIVNFLKSRPSAQPEIIRCKDCKHQVKEWRTDKRLKDNGYMVCGCDVVGDACGYWALLGQDDDYCSMAERRTDD